MAQQNIPKAVEKQVLLLPETFISVGHLFEGQIVLVDDKVSISETEFFVYQKALGQELNNWTYVDVPEVTLSKK